jgi:hypothetical protein
MKVKYRNFVFIIIPFILAACASGSAIVIGSKRNPITPDQVKIYLESPSDYEIIGIVNASSDAGWTEQGSMDYALEELKKQAANLGANGIILEHSGEKNTSTIGSFGNNVFYAIPETAKTLAGKAIFVKSE